MFTLFLTSSPCDGHGGRVFEKNGLREELLRQMPEAVNAVFVASDPDDHKGSLCASEGMWQALEEAGLEFCEWTLLERENADQTHVLVQQADLIILGGGHVPTQNRFFMDIYLREELRTFDGCIMGISAGSMNCADIVYSIPELPGEALSPDYQRFFPGLGLTSIQICPHYDMWKEATLDGMKVYDDIAARDSKGKRFYVFPDGTYMFSCYGYEEIRGRAYLLENGIFRKVCEDGQKVLLPII